MDPLRASNKLRRLIRAYHGSPHSFSRFDASKIGTGEGAQAYGHGLYFAGNEGAAQTYRDKLAPRTLTHGDGVVQQVPWFLPQEAIEDLSRLDDWRAEWAKRIQQAEAKGLPSEYVRKELAVMDAIAAGARVKSGGHMYEVEIGYPEEALLDYDRPFSTPAGATGAAVLRQDNPVAVSDSALRAIQDGSWRMESFAGRSPYETAAVELTRLAKTRGGAQALKDAGIPGIRYLDQGSRSAGEGTRNYVMFPGTEDRIRILRKYGLLAPLGAGAMGGEE